MMQRRLAAARRVHLERTESRWNRNRARSNPLGPSASGRLVAEDAQATGTGSAVTKSHGRVRTPVTEESLTAAKHHRMQPELIFVDEPVLHQRLGQTGAAHDENRLARLALELGNISWNIAD